MWSIRPLEYRKSTLVKQNRWHKTHPHILLPEYEYSLYVDSNVSIKNARVFSLVEHFIKERVLIAIPKHPERNSIYQEAQIIKDWHIDYDEIVDLEMKVLHKAHYPENNGLFANNLILRKHNDKKIIKVMNQWWKMIYRYSKRDQLSLCYVIWKNKLTITPFYIPFENHFINGDFEFNDGQKHTHDFVTSPKALFLKIYLFGYNVFTYIKNIKHNFKLMKTMEFY